MKSFQAIAAFLLGIVLMNATYRHELVLLLLMAACVALVLAIDRWKNAVPFLAAMAVGGSCEAIAVYFNVWQYSNSGFFVTPLWVPVAWGMAAVLFEEAFAKGPTPTFSKKHLAYSFAGTLGVVILFPNELALMVLLLAATAGFFYLRYYEKHELMIGAFAGIFGTGMEVVSVLSGNWNYTNALLIVPLWLPLAWFNGFLIMRRIMRIGEKTEI